MTYAYDANGNLTEYAEYEHQGSNVWTEELKWVYTWNVRDQLTLAMKWDEGVADNSGSVAYEYCLSCDSAMSRRFVYAGGTTTTQGALQEGQRFVYDGLTLLRVDQLYDSDEDEALEMTDGWRVGWENATMPALLGGLLAKRVYAYPNDQSGTSNGHTDYYYAHDAIGNVIAVSDGAGARQHHFTQDAFGNELTLDSLGGDDWNAAHENGIWEHQTGKWLDPETGLYFFHARWVDPVVGRFVGRTALPRHVEGAYEYCSNDPVHYYDPDGRDPQLAGGILACHSLEAIMAFMPKTVQEAWKKAGGVRECIRRVRSAALDGTIFDPQDWLDEITRVGKPTTTCIANTGRIAGGQATYRVIRHIRVGGRWITRVVWIPIGVALTAIEGVALSCDWNNQPWDPATDPNILFATPYEDDCP